MSKKYMNGRGINKRTRELQGKLWENIEGAIFGSTLALVAPFAAGVAAFAFDAYIIAFLLLSAIPVGIAMALPWHKAHAEITRHREAMEAETAKRGKGWASS